MPFFWCLARKFFKIILLKNSPNKIPPRQNVLPDTNAVRKDRIIFTDIHRVYRQIKKKKIHH